MGRNKDKDIVSKSNVQGQGQGHSFQIKCTRAKESIKVVGVI